MKIIFYLIKALKGATMLNELKNVLDLSPNSKQNILILTSGNIKAQQHSLSKDYIVKFTPYFL